MSIARVLLAAFALCPAGAPAPDALGVTAVGKVASTTAMQLNAEGKQLYRQEKWQEARQKYRAALAADPTLLGARLNIACSLSRQQFYAEAAADASALIRTAFVPWSREVHEAADLGILQDHPALYASLEAASVEAAHRWGGEALRGIPLVARTKPPLKVAGEGVLVLGLNQEAFAWVPETNRFVQLTAEDGRVLAMAVSEDGGSIFYVLGGKLVRHPGARPVLRGLSLRVLALATMTLSKPVAVPTDVTKVQIAYVRQPTVRLFGEVSDETFELSGDRLHARAVSMPSGSVELTASGVQPSARHVDKPCGLQLLPHARDGVWGLRARSRRGTSVDLDTRYGAGLWGLPFPDAAPSTPSAGKK